jgi:hypothetical protein
VDGKIVEFFDFSSMDGDTFVDFILHSQFD